MDNFKDNPRPPLEKIKTKEDTIDDYLSDEENNNFNDLIIDMSKYKRIDFVGGIRGVILVVRSSKNSRYLS